MSSGVIRRRQGTSMNIGEYRGISGNFFESKETAFLFREHQAFSPCLIPLGPSWSLNCLGFLRTRANPNPPSETLTLKGKE